MTTEAELSGALKALTEEAARLGLSDTDRYLLMIPDVSVGETYKLLMKTEAGGLTETPFRSELGWNADLAYQTLTTITRTIADVRSVQHQVA